MPFGWAAAATAVVGAYSANQQSKAAKKASNNQKAAMDEQTQLGEDQLDFSKQQYAAWQKRFDPIMDDLESAAYAQQRPDYTQIAADNTSAFDASQGAAERNLQRYGINPEDGAYADLQQRGSMQRALGLVTANTQARAQAKDATYNRLSSLYAVGNGQASNANSNMQAAYSGLRSAYGNQSNVYGQQASNYNQQAQASWNDVASGIGYGLQSWAGGGAGQQQPSTSTPEQSA